jgi:hypothetical protein
MTDEEPKEEKEPKKSKKPQLPPEGELWTSPVTFDAKSMSTLMRDCLDELGYNYERRQSDKLYNQLMVVMPLPKTAYVYRFVLKKPLKVWIDFYDIKPSHAGFLPMMDIQGFTEAKAPKLKKIFNVLIKKLPRPPWKFALSQKFQHGLLIPEWRRAKKAWRRLGYTIK